MHECINSASYSSSAWCMFLCMCSSVMNTLELIQYLFFSTWLSEAISNDSDSTIHFNRFATASVILQVHKSTVNKKLILCSYNSHVVRFCSSDHRSEAERAGDSFRSNESVTQMTRSWFEVNCRKIQCVTMNHSLSY